MRLLLIRRGGRRTGWRSRRRRKRARGDCKELLFGEGKGFEESGRYGKRVLHTACRVFGCGDPLSDLQAVVA